MKKIVFPALTFLVVTVLVNYLYHQPTFNTSIDIMAWFIPILISNMIWQALAFISCWALVLRREKEQSYVWTNYVVWMIIANLGLVMEIINR